MLGFFLRHAQPVAVKASGRPAKRQTMSSARSMALSSICASAWISAARLACPGRAGPDWLGGISSGGPDGRAAASGGVRQARRRRARQRSSAATALEFGGQFGQRQRVTGGQAKRGGRHGKSVNRVKLATRPGACAGQQTATIAKVRGHTQKPHRWGFLLRSASAFCTSLARYNQVSTTVSGFSEMVSMPLPPATWRSPGDRTGLDRRCRHTCSGGGGR